VRSASGFCEVARSEPPPEYFATAIDLRNGKIVRVVEYPTLEGAVEAGSARH
jgi:hypothetical protein